MPPCLHMLKQTRHNTLQKVLTCLGQHSTPSHHVLPLSATALHNPPQNPGCSRTIPGTLKVSQCMGYTTLRRAHQAADGTHCVRRGDLGRPTVVDGQQWGLITARTMTQWGLSWQPSAPPVCGAHLKESFCSRCCVKFVCVSSHWPKSTCRGRW